jgi:hypothetical protein
MPDSRSGWKRRYPLPPCDDIIRIAPLPFQPRSAAAAAVLVSVSAPVEQAKSTPAAHSANVCHHPSSRAVPPSTAVVVRGSRRTYEVVSGCEPRG